MNEKNDQISSEQALEVIKGMIENSKQKRRNEGFYHLFWGIVISMATLSMYFLIKAEMYSYIGWSWAGFTIPGAFISIMHSRKHYTKRGASYADLGIGATWYTLMFAMVLVCFVYPMLNAYSSGVIFILSCLLLGFANLITGMILRDKLPIVNGIIWWLGSIGLLLVSSALSITIIFIGLLFLNNILPGIYLISQERKYNGK